MKPTRPRRSRFLLVAVLTALATVFLAPSPAGAGTQTEPAAASDSINEVRTLHLVRINCDDEMESFSDEIRLYINGQFFGGINNVDGGDWWNLNINIAFEDPVIVQLWENDGVQIGYRWIYTSEAFLGLTEVVWTGSAGTGYRYRFYYYVD